MNRLYKNTMVLIAALFLGLTLTIQFKSSQEQVGIVTSETVPQLENELHNLSSEIEGLRQQLTDLRNRVREYERAMDAQGGLNEVLEQQLAQAKVLAGLAEVKGPGI